MFKLFKAACLASLLAFTTLAFSAAPPFIPSPQPQVYISEDSLVIRNTLLIEQLVNEALSLLDSHPKVQRLWLIDIRGGVTVPAARLAWRAQEMDVIVAGGCYSACADVALSGKTLKFAPWQGKLPSAIIIHGTFRISGDWVSVGLQNLSRYAERLDPISRKDIEEAISFPYPSDAGLYLFTDGSVRAAKGQTALLCEYFPSKCRAIDVSLDQIHIAKSDLPVPPELPVEADMEKNK